MGTEQAQPPTPTAQPSVATTDQSQIQPRDMSQQPTPTAPAQPAPQPQAAAPTQPAAATQPQGTQPLMQHAPANPQSSLHARIFDGVLKTLSGGPIKVLQSDPTTGETRQVEVPQSGSKMANSILAGVLSSMFSGVESRQPGYNGPPPSTAPIMGSHGTMHAEEQAKQQALVDQMQDRKMKVLKANLDQMTASMAATRMGDEQMDKQIADGANQVALAKTYDEGQQDPTAPKAIQKTNLTSTEAQQMIQGSKLGWIAVPSGRTSHMDPNTGKVVSEPTYTVLDPHVKVKLTEDEANAMALVNPSWADAWKNSGGNIEVPLDVVNGGRLMRAKVSNVQAALNQFANDTAIAKELGIKGKVGNLMTIAKDPTIRAALAATEQQMAAHAGTDRNYSILDAMLTADGGINLAEKLGIDPMKARTWLNSQHEKRTAADAMAKLGGVGPKSLATQEQVDALQNSVNGLPEKDQRDFQSYFKKDDEGNSLLSTADLQKAQAAVNSRVNANANIAERNALANGDPVAAQKTANNTIEGDVNNITKIASMRGNARENAVNAIHDEATKRGLDTTKFSEQALEDKADMLKDFDANKKGSTGSQISSFNAFLGHTSGAVDAEKRLAGKTLGLTGKPVINSALRDIGKQLTNDPDWKAYQTALVPVKNEIENFLAAGYAVKSEDSAVMHQILDDNETPERITAALKQLAETADIRLAAMGQKYLDRMDTTYSHLLSADSINTLKNLKIDSKAAKLATPLPRGWVNNQAQPVTNADLAKKFVQAAGNDKDKAMDLAKNNGWILNLK